MSVLTLHANDWLSAFTCQLQEMRAMGLFCDVVIDIDDGQPQSAHSNILAACSPVLSTYILGKGRLITIDGIHSVTWQHLLKFMYSGQVCSH